MLDLGKDAAGTVVDLTKEAGKEVTRVTVSLTWKQNSTSGVDYDPDVVAFVLDSNDKVVGGNEQNFVRAFPKSAPNAVSPDGALNHSGDDTSGAAGGEKLTIDGSRLSPQAAKVRAAVTIFHAKTRKHNFGLIKNCTIKVTDADTGTDIVTGDLSFDNSVFTALNAVDVIRRNGKLYVQYLGEGYNGGLGGLCKDHGVLVGKNDYDDGFDA